MKAAWIAAFSVQSFVQTQLGNGLFEFQIDKEDLHASFVVFNSDKELVRTIESAVDVTELSGGKNIRQWDGLLDDGTIAPNGNYNIEVRRSAVIPKFVGTLANSSTHQYSNRFNTAFHDLVCASGKMKVAGGYAERAVTTKQFALNNIGEYFPATDPAQDNKIQSISTFKVCYNGKYVFWAGNEPYSNQTGLSLIVASNPLDDTQAIFTNGQAVTVGIEYRQYYSALIVQVNANDIITGLAANLNFLYTCRNDTNVLECRDLRNDSGAFLRSVNLGPGLNLIAVYQNTAWATVNQKVIQYSIGSEGELTATGIEILISNVGDIKISDQGEMMVLDANSHQAKFFNAVTGQSVDVLGQLGGNNVTAIVANDRFLFYAKGNGSKLPACAYEPDGSFWIVDVGNSRVMHFNADRTYKNQIDYTNVCRSINVDLNDATLVSQDTIFYRIDYTKLSSPLTAYKLIYNFTANTSLDVFAQFISVATLSNGYIYAVGIAPNSGDNVQQLYVLNPQTGAQFVKTLNFVQPVLESDGSIYTRELYAIGGGYGVIGKKYPLMGFNGLVPQFGAPIVIYTTPVYANTEPFTFQNNTRGANFNPLKQFFFNPDPRSADGTPHLAYIPTGGIAFKSKAMPEISGLFSYPKDGSYYNDGGHSENCTVNAVPGFVITHVNSELGYLTEACVTNVFDEDLVHIVGFGNDNQSAQFSENEEYLAGNSFKTAAAKRNNDVIDYFYCDERGRGIFMCEISGLSTIKKQVIPVKVVSAITPIIDTKSLMNGLPYRGSNYGTSRWITENGSPTIQTNLYSFGKNQIDLKISGGTGDRLVSIPLLTPDSLSAWEIKGEVCFRNGQLTFDDFNVYSLLSVYDKAGKQMTILTCRYSGIFINNINISTNFLQMNFWNKVSFKYSNSVLKFKFADYPDVTINTTWDAGADKSKPDKLKIQQHVVSHRNDTTSLAVRKFTINY